MPPGTFVGVDPAAEVAALRADTSGAEPASSEAFDVVVLGGGLAGLCAAHRLAKRGVKRVVLLEAADAIGGNARSGGDCPSAPATCRCRRGGPSCTSSRSSSRSSA